MSRSQKRLTNWLKRIPLQDFYVGSNPTYPTISLGGEIEGPMTI